MVNVSFLDTKEAQSEVDLSDLAQIIRSFPEQLETAISEFSKVELPSTWHSAREVVFCGMGGSAIGGEIACDLPAKLMRKPLHIIREYGLPAFVGPDSLVVTVSYSGETEEALACFREARDRGAMLAVITGGSTLAAEAKAAGAVLYLFNFQAPPRDALGYLFAPLLRILEAAGVLEKKEVNLMPAIESIRALLLKITPEVPTEHNRAKELAYLLYDHMPIIIGSALTRSVARRWKGQLNEHGKASAAFDVLPEANHNTVEGLQFPVRFRDDAVVMLLRSNYDHPEVIKRFNILEQFLGARHIAWHEPKLNLGQQDLWSEKLTLICLGDWVSYYLALLYRVDPAPVPAIAELKVKLRG